MTSAASFIDALLQRRVLRTRGNARDPGEFPTGWAQWFAAMRPNRDAVTGDTAAHWIALLAAREPARPPCAGGALNRWQAFATLWRQEWHPPGREDRRVRWSAAFVSAVVHLLFAIGLLWLMLLQWAPIEPAAPEGEDVIQVEYIGVAARPDVGGGVPQAAPDAAAQPSDAPAPTDTPADARPTPPSQVAALATPALATTVPGVARREIPMPPTPAAQPLVVSAPAPDPAESFVLPPTTARVPTPPAPPQLETRVPDLRVVDVPAPARLPQARIAPSTVTTPDLAVRDTPVIQREIPTPVVAPIARVRPTVDIAPRSRPTDAPQVTTRSIAMPASAAPISAPGPPASSSTVRSAARVDSPSNASATAATRPAAGAPSRTPGTSPGAGPRPVATAGARPSTNRGDDFDAARRDRAGGTRGAPGGLYNPDGSVRIADRPGSASSGLPPGSLVQEIQDLDRAGTWLRRRPADYRGTRFDEAWRPSETLLQEWVRKSVTTVRIPVPGSKKTIVCQTVLLAMGGGCTVIDPDLNDQPARARPPPDIPFKPHLQDDNGAVKPAG